MQYADFDDEQGQVNSDVPKEAMRPECGFGVTLRSRQGYDGTTWFYRHNRGGLLAVVSVVGDLRG